LRLNQGLYQLSYSHRARRQDSRPRPDFPVTRG